MKRALAFALLAACSFPEKHLATGDAPRGSGSDGGIDGRSLIDAPSGFECKGRPLPTTAPASITVSGLIVDSTGANPVPNATVGLYDPNGVLIGATTNTGMTGNYSLQIQTGGVPVDGHVTATNPNFVPTANYRSAPLAADTDVSFGMIDSNSMSALANAAGTNYNPQFADIAVFVDDCDSHPQAGAVVPNPQTGATERYAAGGALPASATSTDSSGQVYLLNVMPATLTISGTLADNTPELPRTIHASGNEFIYVGLQPGP